ncbi:MAG: hypothetical protein JNK66_09255 [Chitinophagales bacterium]|nr:hypothetical protein [Chitinophagales bacterium]
MKQKIKSAYEQIIKWITINLAWVYCLACWLLRKRLTVYYANLTDPLLTTEVATLVWNTKYCYKLSIEDNAIVPATNKYTPVTIKKDRKQIRVVFYGIGTSKEVVIPIKNEHIKIKTPITEKISIPSFLSFEPSVSEFSFNTRKENKTTILTSGQKVSIPDFTISFPQFINETEESTP